jgi:autotransporter adhesin
MNFSTTVHKDGLADGYHYATLMGRVHTANTGTWVGGGALSATALALSIQR